MSKAIEELEQQQSKLEKDNKRLNETNDMLLEITKKQRLMVGSSKESRGKRCLKRVPTTTNVFEFRRVAVQTAI